MKRLLYTGLFIFILVTLPLSAELKDNDILYQIYPNSFYDSDGDGIGDLSGIKAKLDYLQELGVTVIWLNPIFLSPFEHKYFADDFLKIDPELGTLEDFRMLCKDIHKHGMKILIDMETHYVTDRHLFFKDSYENPSSPYSEYMYYHDPENTQFESIIAGITQIYAPGAGYVKVATLNLSNPKVLEYQKKVYAYWLDPNNDGNLEDGVDGFRIDHIMDDMDNKGIFTDLYANFWKPIVDYTRTINPDCIYIAEPADWGFGSRILDEADMDGVLFMPIRNGLIENDSFQYNSNNMNNVLARIERDRKQDKYLLTNIENHDTSRLATSCKGNLNILKIGAVLTTTLPPLPHIYYGQELGQPGKKDLGNRDAFMWTDKFETSGMAYEKRKENFPNNVIKSLQTEKQDPDSVYSFYKTLLAIRKNKTVLQTGDIVMLPAKNDAILAYMRTANDNNNTIIVIINFSPKKERLSIDLSKIADIKEGSTLVDLISGNRMFTIKKNNLKNFHIIMSGYDVLLLEVE